jgi:hypothetical protein
LLFAAAKIFWGESMSRGYCVLRDKIVVPVSDAMEWALQFEYEDRRVAETTIGPIWISTIFLGLDHSFGKNELPLVFETLIFRGGEGQEMWRCASWQEAEAQHAAAVALVRKEIQENIDR